MREKFCGIYCIENIINGNRYIGKAIDINARFNNHKHYLRKNNHPNGYLQNSWNKYGEINFSFYIVEICKMDVSTEREKYYIKLYKTKRPDGYNLTDGGDGNLGWIVTEEARENMSKSHTGWKASEETKRNMSIAKSGEKHPLWGKKLDKKWIENMSKSRIGNKNSLGKFSKRKNSPSQYFGVRVHKAKYKENVYFYWHAVFKYNSETKNLGHFKTEEDAARAWDKESWENLHDINKLNFPEDYKNK